MENSRAEQCVSSAEISFQYPLFLGPGSSELEVVDLLMFRPSQSSPPFPEGKGLVNVDTEVPHRGNWKKSLLLLLMPSLPLTQAYELPALERQGKVSKLILVDLRKMSYSVELKPVLPL